MFGIISVLNEADVRWKTFRQILVIFDITSHTQLSCTSVLLKVVNFLLFFFFSTVSHWFLFISFFPMYKFISLGQLTMALFRLQDKFQLLLLWLAMYLFCFPVKTLRYFIKSGANFYNSADKLNALKILIAHQAIHKFHPNPYYQQFSQLAFQILKI